MEYRDSRLYVRVKFLKDFGDGISEEDIDYVDCSMSPHFLKNDFAMNQEAKDSLCSFYAVSFFTFCKQQCRNHYFHFQQHGFCRTRNCPQLHEVDLMLDLECQKVLKKRRRSSHGAAPPKKKTRGLPTAVSKKLDTESETEEELGFHEKTHFSTKGCHRAGMDAFMTGFTVLFSQRMHLFKHQTLDPAFANQTLVPGLEKPLPLVKSSYAPSTFTHRELWEAVAQKKIENLKYKSGIISIE